MPTFAQYKIDAPYVNETHGGINITLKPKSIIYAPNDEQKRRIQQATSNHQYFTFTVNPDNFKPLKIRKQTDFKVSGFIKTGKHIHYDLYIVTYKNKPYFIDPADVIDNTIIDSKNKAIDSLYTSLLDDLHIKEEAFRSLYVTKLQEIEDSLAIINNKEKRKNIITDSLYNVFIESKKTEITNNYQDWYNKLTPTAKKAAGIITIQTSKLRSPNSAGGCDYELWYTNMSNKTIKYLYWYGNVFNAVNDKVTCEIRRSYEFSGKDTGPVPKGTTWGGTWDCVIYNYSAKEMRLNKITIMYTDGTSASISSKDIKSLIGAPDCNIENVESIYSFERRTIESNIDRDIRAEKRKLDDSKYRLTHFDSYTSSTNLPDDYKELIRLLKSITTIKEEIMDFEYRNMIDNDI